MTILRNPIPFTSLTRRFDPCFEALNRNENVSITNISSRQQPYRIYSLLKNKKKYAQFPKNRTILTVDLSSHTTEEASSIKKLFKPKKRATVFVLNADRLLTDKRYLSEEMNSSTLSHTNTRAVYLFQSNILEQKNKIILSPYGTFFQNVVPYANYDENETDHFITYLESLYNCVVPKEIRKEIVAQCCGHLWLVKEAVRYWVKTHDTTHLFSHPEIIARLETIEQELSKPVYELYKNIILGKEIEKTAEFEFCFATDSIRKTKKGGYNITSRLLEEYIRKKMQNAVCIQFNDKKQITINNICIQSLLTQREYALLSYFLEYKGTIVTREQAGYVLWGNNSSYSDWALDQVIRRLRNKLLLLGLRTNIIQTIRNKGFRFLP